MNMAKADAARQPTWEAAFALVREGGQDDVDTANETEREGNRQEVRSDPSSASRGEAAGFRSVAQNARGKCVTRTGAKGEDISRREERVGEAQKVKEPGWRHIGRVPDAPDPALKGSDLSPRRPPQLPAEVCECILDWLWYHARTLQNCALVCKAWTPRCRYWMQRTVVLRDRSHVQGHARRARAQSHILQQARSVAVVGPVRKEGDRAPIPQLGTLAIMGAAKLQLVWRLEIQRAIWRPSDFHPHFFFYLSASSSVTALRLIDVTFPKVREFGRLICALPSLVRLTCENVLFTSTAPCTSLAITRYLPSARLTDLMIFSTDETSSNIVEAKRLLIEHLCAVGVIADLQAFEFYAEASSDNKYLDAYRGALHELFQQCSQSLRYLKFSLNLHPGKGLHPDTISDTIASIFDLTCCDSLETVILNALNFEQIGHAWMPLILESNVSRKLREVSIVMDRPNYSRNAKENLQKTVFALKRDVCAQLDKLFSNKAYEKLDHVDFVFWTRPEEAIPDATGWVSLLEAEMPKLHERGVLRTRVDVDLTLFHEDFF